MTKAPPTPATKVTYARRRCRSCREQFTPKPGGRPALFCSTKCRQRAYKARKSAAASQKKRTGGSRTPRPSPLIVGSVGERLFKPEDAKGIFQRSGAQPLEATDFDNIARELNFIAQGYLGGYRRGTGPTAGEQQKWFRSVERSARRLLQSFGMKTPLDHLDSSRTANLVGALLHGVPVSDGVDFYLRHSMARETGASEPPSEWIALRASIRCIQFLLHRATLAADAAGRDKGAPRKSPEEEENLVAQLHDLYQNVTGDTRWSTTDDVNDTRGGPFVRFAMAVVAHVRDHPNLVGTPAGLVKNLRSLTGSDRRIIKRIGQVRSKLKASNRLRSRKGIAPFP